MDRGPEQQQTLRLALNAQADRPVRGRGRPWPRARRSMPGSVTSQTGREPGRAPNSIQGPCDSLAARSRPRLKPRYAVILSAICTALIDDARSTRNVSDCLRCRIHDPPVEFPASLTAGLHLLDLLLPRHRCGAGLRSKFTEATQKPRTGPAPSGVSCFWGAGGGEARRNENRLQQGVQMRIYSRRT